MEDYEEESGSKKLSRKVAENPFMPVGIVGLLACCAYGAYKYKHRGKMSTSIYLIQLRVAAQSAVVGTLTVGVAYNLLKEYYWKKED